ncbi:MAG: PDZ domain-containing protein, partial [Thermoleophilia bacterium]|nr:PDZ domain-containing protein [Thermoleophilia bacterium]
MSILVSLLGLAFLILIHEAGHFFVARAVGMNPRKFYLGFPPAIAKTTRNGIEYGVGAIPLGGYVKIPGMHRPAAGDLDIHFGRAVEEEPTLARPVGELRGRLEEGDYHGARGGLEHVRAALDAPSLSPLALRSAERGLTEIGDSLAPDAYWRATTWKRVAVIFAGPAANLVLAIAIFAALYMALDASYRVGFELRGTTEQVTATVNDVLPNTPAEAIGVQAGDRIVAIDGKRVDGDSIRPSIQASEGRPLTLTVLRD